LVAEGEVSRGQVLVTKTDRFWSQRIWKGVAHDLATEGLRPSRATKEGNVRRQITIIGVGRGGSRSSRATEKGFARNQVAVRRARRGGYGVVASNKGGF